MRGQSGRMSAMTHHRPGSRKLPSSAILSV
jgi:hypothetical protein